MEDCRGDKRYANRLMRIYFGRVELIVARKTDRPTPESVGRFAFLNCFPSKR